MAEQLLYNLNITDNATPTLERFKKSITDVTGKFDDVTKGADKFGSSMLDQAKKLPVISDSCSLLSKSLTVLKTPFVQIPILAGAAVTSLIAFANSNMKTVTELKRMSETTGISVNALAALKKVGAQTETSFESIVGAVTKLEKNMGESGKAFKKLGVEGHEPLTVLASLADRFKATTDPVERARLGFLAFGKSWKDMAPMLAQGGDAIRKAQESTTISEAMVARYEKMHRDQLAISGAASAWKSALGDLASGPLALITGMLADMAKKSAEIAKNIRAATNKEADVDFAEKWLSGSDEVAKSKLKGVNANAAKRSGHGGLDIQSHTETSTDDVRNKWALESFQKLSLDEKESVVNGVGNKGAHQLLSTLTEETINQMKASVEKLRKEKDKILGQADKEGEAKERLNAELRLYELFEKTKSQLAIDQAKDGKEKAILQSEEEYREKVKTANKAFEDIKGASKADKEKLNGILQALEIEHNAKLKAIDEKFEKESLERRIKNFNEQIKAQEDIVKQSKEIQKLTEQAYLDNLEDGKEKELEETKIRYEDDLVTYSNNERAKVLLKERYEGQISKINKKYLDKERKQFEESFKDIGKTIETSLSTPLNNFLKNMTRANHSLSSSFKTLGSQIKDSFGNAVTEMVSHWLAEKAAMYGKELVMYIANLATTQGIAKGAQAAAVTQAGTTGAAMATAQAPAAAMSSIASWGGAAVAGGAALAATLALALAYHANGSNYTYGGLTMVGERGPELVNMPRGSQVVNNENTNALLGGGSTYNITMNNTGITPKQIIRELKIYDQENKRTKRV